MLVSKPDLARQLKNVSEKDRRQIEKAQEMLGPDPATMGFVKNIFWGNFREELVYPYPEVPADEVARCDQLVAALDEYMRNEHPTVEIDQGQETPEWAIKRLFELGVMGMIIPQEYGGGGYGLTSYNRVLKRIGQTCGSTAVMVSAHQSIGCGALSLFGTEEQKKRFLTRMATDTLSAFCLSEPNVGCDAGGQETICTKSEDGETFTIVSGEKKWATSAALAGLFTVMAKQKIKDPKSGKERERITALICTPDMEGIDIFSRNRSKTCIRGTWQARIRFNNVKVPKENLLHKEGKGLNVALTCLNYGRCTLSAGMVGAAQTALEQGSKWAQTRHQFDRALAEFEMVQDNIATMAAYVYATEAMLYMTTGMVDRGDEDIMLETALCKVFCSEMGYRTVNLAMQIMGGEGFMTENQLERIWRDSRINTVVEGANEVMHSFVFAYGSKQLGEHLLAIKERPMGNFTEAARLGLELFLGVKRSPPRISRLSPRLIPLKHRLEQHVRNFSYEVKQMFKTHAEGLITNQMIQRRLSLMSMWMHATACVLSRVDRSIRAGHNGEALDDELRTVEHFCALASRNIDNCRRGLRTNADETMRRCAEAALRHISTLPNSEYAIPESTPDEAARGTGMVPDQAHIQQFGEGSIFAGENAQA
ncbi:MAG: acyl-CoA dehydrogenase [Planctomycetes bacterium]|nr:acyl-CoA dehydrogenase [Planctomycetota bacterium]